MNSNELKPFKETLENIYNQQIEIKKKIAKIKNSDSSSTVLEDILTECRYIESDLAYFIDLINRT